MLFFYQFQYQANLIIINQLFQEKNRVSISFNHRILEIMLPYHSIYPQKREQNDSEFLHYLSLGSYSTSFINTNLLSFSKITLSPKKYLPKLSYDQLKAKCESQGFKFHTLTIPLYGNFTINQTTVTNVLEQQQPIDKKQDKKDGFTMSEMKFVINAEYISNKDEKDNSAVFLYMLCKVPVDEAEGLISHADRLLPLIQQKKFNHHQIHIGSSSLQISFIQVLEDTKFSLNPNDFFYLEKGKVTLYLEGESDKVELKNKGNRKGEQNYIDNMIFISQEVNITVEKGSLFFLISTQGIPLE